MIDCLKFPPSSLESAGISNGIVSDRSSFIRPRGFLSWRPAVNTSNTPRLRLFEARWNVVIRWFGIEKRRGGDRGNYLRIWASLEASSDNIARLSSYEIVIARIHEDDNRFQPVAEILPTNIIYIYIHIRNRLCLNQIAIFLPFFPLRFPKEIKSLKIIIKSWRKRVLEIRWLIEKKQFERV